MTANDSNPTPAFLRQELEEGTTRSKAALKRMAAQRAAKKVDTKKAAAKRDSGVTVADDGAKGKPADWRLGHTIGLMLLLALIVAACVLFPRWAAGETLGVGSGTWRLGLWLLTVVLLGGSFVLIGHGAVGLANGCLIDNRNRLSLSRLQQFSWTVLVLSAFLTFASFETSANPNGDPLDVGVPTQVWSLLLISTGSLTGAAFIKNRKRNLSVDEKDIQEPLDKTKEAMTASEGKSLDHQSILATKKEPQNASIADLFRGDEVGSAAQLELGKVQMFFFTLIVLFAYAANLGFIFYGPRGLPAGLPDVSEGMVVLLLISHAGFLGSKAIPASPTSTAA